MAAVPWLGLAFALLTAPPSAAPTSEALEGLVDDTAPEHPVDDRASSTSTADPAVHEARSRWAAAEDVDTDEDPDAAVQAWSEVVVAARAVRSEAQRRAMVDGAVRNLALARLRHHRRTGAPEQLTMARRDIVARQAQRGEPSPDLAALLGVVEAEADRRADASASGPVKRSPLWIAGVGVTAGAAVPLIAMGVGLGVGRGAEADYDAGPTRDERDRADRRGATGNALAFGGALAAGLMVGIGVGLIAMARQGERSRRHAHIRVSPVAHPNLTGLRLGARF